jgi:hypothetical protein
MVSSKAFVHRIARKTIDLRDGALRILIKGP